MDSISVTNNASESIELVLGAGEIALVKRNKLTQRQTIIILSPREAQMIAQGIQEHLPRIRQFFGLENGHVGEWQDR